VKRYIVLKWNQASGRPSVGCDEIFEAREDAEETRDDFAMRATIRGRADEYSVAPVEIGSP
jgi:hypothetical protein